VKQRLQWRTISGHNRPPFRFPIETSQSSLDHDRHRNRSMPYPIKQMRLGEIFDQAIAIVRDHYVLLFSILFALQIPVQLVQYFFLLSFAPVILPDSPPQEAWQLLVNWLARYWPWLLGVVLLNVFVVYPISMAALNEAIVGQYLGRRITFTEAIRRAAQKLLPFEGTMLLAWLCYAGAYCLCFLPVFLPLFFFALWQQVVVVEGIAGVAALRRSTYLVRQDWLTFFVLGLVIFVFSLMLNFGANFIRQPHLRIVTGTLLQAVTTLVSTAALVVFYFSSRCKSENFDLHFLAESIGSQVLETEPGATIGKLP
jgi:hypothetical protein